MESGFLFHCYSHPEDEDDRADIGAALDRMKKAG
jgi:hypothetical protein